MSEPTGRELVEANYVRMEAEIAALKAEVERLKQQRQGSIGAEKKDCDRALVALSAAGICTPEETYGFNTSWAISDMCRAISALRERLDALEAENARLSAPV